MCTAVMNGKVHITGTLQGGVANCAVIETFFLIFSARITISTRVRLAALALTADLIVGEVRPREHFAFGDLLQRRL